MDISVAFEGRIGRHENEVSLGETLAMLEGIAEASALKGAARRTRLSYRAIWGKIARIEALLGAPIAIRTKGHGTILTEAGEALRAALADCTGRLAPVLQRESDALNERLRSILTAGAAASLVLAASHDPLLVRAAQGIAGLRLDILGSSDALAALRAGRADMAGCHFGSFDASPPAGLADELRAEGFTWTVLFRRAQGLMVAPGNPLGIASIADIPAKKARFVNRQPGSGTRIWFDRLLASHGVTAEAIDGYRDEEFTHQAVAAVIAAGRADTALGAQSAAAKFGLDFVLLGEESYFVIFPVRSQSGRPINDLVIQINRHKDAMPGYRSAILET